MCLLLATCYVPDTTHSSLRARWKLAQAPHYLLVRSTVLLTSSLLTTCYSLLTTYYSLPTTHYVLLTTYSLLLTTYRLLVITSEFQMPRAAAIYRRLSTYRSMY